MPSRNDYRNIVINDSFLRESIHDRRHAEKIKILTKIPSNSITEEDKLNGIYEKMETFEISTKMYKLSNKYYGSPDYWWLIAWYNKKPTDSHFKVGDPVYIPLPFEKMISIATRER